MVEVLLFHIYALTASMNLALLAGGTMIILPRFDIDAVLQHINDYEPTFFPGASTMYVAVINHPRIKEYKVSSIHCCLSGSAPLPKEVAIRLSFVIAYPRQPLEKSCAVF